MWGIKRVVAAAIFATLCAGSAPHSSAATPGADAARIQVEHVLRAVEQALVRGDDATTIAKMMYAENAVIAGEGQKGSTHGMAGAIEEFRGWMDSLGPAVKGCTFTIVDPVVASPGTFVSFVQLHCKASPPALPQPQDYRVMYAWKKEPDGWRVVLEMYVSGTL